MSFLRFPEYVQSCRAFQNLSQLTNTVLKTRGESPTRERVSPHQYLDSSVSFLVVDGGVGHRARDAALCEVDNGAAVRLALEEQTSGHRKAPLEVP